MKSKLRNVAAMMLVMGPIAAQAAPELTTNGGFETPFLAGWSCVGADLCSTSSDSHSGTGAFIGFDNDGFASLSQTVATTVGVTYEFSFWSKDTFGPTAPANILRYDLGAGPVLVASSFDYALTAATFVATAATTTISFLFETDPGTGVWFIDDASVMSTAAVPEPASLALLGLALAGLGFGRRKKA